MSLPYSPVDAHSPVPLYYQIYLDLRQMIRQGVIPAGGMLPPEMEISQAYNVGRQTVRQSLARLVDEELVERFPGRGTFVRSQARHTEFFLDRSFSQQMRELGRTPHSRVLRLEMATADPALTPALKEYGGAPCLTLERLRLGDDEPICHQISSILAATCPGIEDQDFEKQSLYEVLARRYHLAIHRISHTVRAVAADDYRADLLEVEPGTPLLFVGTTTYLETGEIIEYTASYYRADRFEYRIMHSYLDE
ncbi:MAG: GntR family transcriptional regulator [Bacteroidota bacterium]